MIWTKAAANKKKLSRKEKTAFSEGPSSLFSLSPPRGERKCVTRVSPTSGSGCWSPPLPPYRRRRSTGKGGRRRNLWDQGNKNRIGVIETDTASERWRKPPPLPLDLPLLRKCLLSFESPFLPFFNLLGNGALCSLCPFPSNDLPITKASSSVLATSHFLPLPLPFPPLLPNGTPSPAPIWKWRKRFLSSFLDRTKHLFSLPFGSINWQYFLPSFSRRLFSGE